MFNINEIYLLKKDEIIDFKKKCKEKGYEDVYYNQDDWHKLINIIVSWYTFKYPTNIINMLREEYEDKDTIIFTRQEYDYLPIENLNNHMDYTSLMFRIPTNLYPLIECWYKSNKNNIYLNNTNDKVSIPFSIDEYDGGITNLDHNIYNHMFRENCPTLDKFIKFINKNTYDVSEMEKIVETHNMNLKLRKLYFELIIYMIIKNSENNVIGYVRASKFIEEFNKYIYNLNLSNNKLDIIQINDKEEIDYILNKLKNEEKTIDTFGLSFKAIKILKYKKINNLNDLNDKNISNIFYYNTIENNFVSKRDEEILKNIFREIESNNTEENILDAVLTNTFYPKKKRLFRK